MWLYVIVHFVAVVDHNSVIKDFPVMPSVQVPLRILLRSFLAKIMHIHHWLRFISCERLLALDAQIIARYGLII